MKIAVKDIEPNPFRRIETYPIDRGKVEDLKSTIKNTFYWPGQLMARKHNGKYQLAFGHHRWIALKELGIKEIEVSVCKMDDATMLKAMADENMQAKQSPVVMIQTVLAAKDFLDAELAKHETWRDLSDKSIRQLFESETVWRNTKSKGVGRDTILKFLKSSWWKKWMVQEALKTIKDDKEGTVDRKAVELLPTTEHAARFRAAVKTYEIPKKKQVAVAKEVAKEGVGKRGVESVIAKHALPAMRKKVALEVKKEVPMIGSFVMKCEEDSDSLNRRLKTLLPDIEDLIESPGQLGRLVSSLKRLSVTSSTIIEKYEGNRKCQLQKGKKEVSCINAG